MICTFPWRIIQQSLESLCSETSLKLKTFDMAFQEPCKSSRFCRNGWMGEETTQKREGFKGEGTLKFDHIQGEGGMREGFIHYFLALALALALMETLNKSHSRGEQNMLV